MSDVIMPDGSVAKIADFALESTAQQMLKQLSMLDKNNTKAHKELLDHAKKEAKETEKFRKDDESDREDLYKATLDVATAIRDQSKKAEKKEGPAPAVGAELPQTLTRLSQGATTTAEQINTVGEKSVEASEGVGQLGDSSDAAKAQLDKFNKGAAMGEKAFVKFYDGSILAGQTLVAGAILYGGMLVDSFVGLGQELNELTKSGVAFTDGVSTGGMTATDAMMRLSASGLDAVGTMSSFSSVVQTMGKSAFVGMTDQFLEMTDKGAEFGLSLEDSVERMGAELQKRQLMGALEGVSQAQLQKTIQTTIKNQQKYAAALGTSTEELASFTEGLLQQTPVLTASLFRLDASLRNQVIGGITDFATTLRAMGGEEGGAIAAAMTEAAASGALGFSDGMVGYVTALPSLAGPMNDYISAIQDGTLSQEQAEEMALGISSMLGNVTEAEKERVFALARAGDAQAEQMAKAITQFEQSEKKLKEMNKGFEMSEVQKGTNVLTAIFKEFTGIFEAMKTGFLVGVGDAGDAATSIKEALLAAQGTIMKSLGQVLPDIFGGTGDVFKDLTGGAEALGSKIGKVLPTVIEKAAGFISSAIEVIPDIVEGFKTAANVVGTIFKVLGFVTAPLILAFKILSPIVNAVIDVLSGFASGVIDTVLFPFKLLAPVFTAVGDAAAYITKPFTAVGDALSNFFGGFGAESEGFLKTVGYVAGVVTTLGVALGKISFSGLISGIGSFAGTLKTGAGKIVESLGGGLSKITGGMSDKLFSGGKQQIAAKAQELDMGTKAMDKAAKSSRSLTQTVGKGMKDISKGIKDLFVNIGKAIGSVGKSIGKGLGGIFSGLAGGLKALGDPKVLLGVAALGGIGASMFIAGKAFQQFADINWAQVGMGAVALGVLGTAAFLIAPIAPAIGVGALAIGALGLALVPFAAAVKIAAPAMVELMGSFELLNDVDPKNMLLLGPALVSLAAGMAAFSAGGLVSSILDGLGSLFGGDSPFDKLAKIGAAAPAINSMTDNMNNFGQTVENFNTALEKLDGKAAADEFATMALGIDKLNASMEQISMLDMMKLAAFGPIQQSPATIDPPTQQVRSGTGGARVANPGGGAPRTIAQTPSVAQAMRPLGTGVDTQTATRTLVSGTNDPIAQSMSRTGSDQNSLTDALERMVAKQDQTNRLLQKGNRITSDLSDDF